MIRVGITGATGYTGQDAIECLLRHDQAEITALTAFTECGPLEEIFPALKDRLDMEVTPLDIDDIAGRTDVILCCLPHKVSMGYVPEFLKRGLKVVDFSADYRLKDKSVYEQYYTEHTDPHNIARAAFGLPELFRPEIEGRNLVANPGCYPSSAALGLAPLLKKGLIETDNIIVNAATGVTGGGKKPNKRFHFPNMNENYLPYAIGGTHRHSPEINQICSEVAGEETTVLFQPHVLPVDRGILSSIYARPKSSVTSDEVFELFAEFYKNETFVRVCREPVTIKQVARTNFCDIHPCVSADGKTVIVFSALDNLMKGASGQAIQNMNIITGIEETKGLL